MPTSVHVVNDKAYKLLKEIPGNAAFVRFNLRFGYSVYCLLPQLAPFYFDRQSFLIRFQPALPPCDCLGRQCAMKNTAKRKGCKCRDDGRKCSNYCLCSHNNLAKKPCKNRVSKQARDRLSHSQHPRPTPSNVVNLILNCQYLSWLCLILSINYHTV